jgi:signal transduction histidine kinase
MHDVLSHTIGVIAIQAGAGERLAAHNPDAAADTFRAIRETGGEALAELRRTLGLIRNGDDPGLAPQPGLHELEALSERARAAGLHVDLRVELNGAEVPAGVELAAYRIVQEAVTNTLRHARARHLHISIRVEDEELQIDVLDDGQGGVAEGLGHGLTGISERAALYDGWVKAEPLEQGGFAVHAVLRVSH